MINGAKGFTTNAGYADVCVAMAVRSRRVSLWVSAFILEKGVPGLRASFAATSPLCPSASQPSSFQSNASAFMRRFFRHQQPGGQLNQSLISRSLKAMDVELTPDQKAFARRAIESGRFHSEQEAVREALALWEERERQRTEFLLTLDDARDSLARGEGRVITQESVRQLASEVKERGRARLLAELSTSH